VLSLLRSLRLRTKSHARPDVLGVLTTVLTVWTASCSSPTRPTQPPEAPALSCPASRTIASADNRPVTWIYPKPVLTGGAAPVHTTCTPAQDSLFPLGSTTVTCTIVDAQQRSASCAFTINVQPAITLNASRVLAFGDSITEGKTAAGLQPSVAAVTGCPNDLTSHSTSYPKVLAASLTSLYSVQTIPVTNCGSGGETATQGVVRLPTAFALAPYDVVLLMEGANDLNEVSQAGGTQAAAVDQIANSMVSMIRNAQAGGRTVFVGTLPPERGGAGSKASRPEWVVPVNNRLRTVVPQQGAVLVDIYQALGGSADPYIDTDGLHPTVAGHAVIANAFLNAIQAKLERRTQ
jgi:lysophospholipase L1-like esterase